MFWLSDILLSHTRSIEILPFLRSDHSYLFLEIDPLPSSKRRPGVWNFNMAHLKDDDFHQLVNDFWTSWRNEKSRFSLLSTWWDAGKVRLKSIIREFSHKKAKRHRATVKSLNATLYHIQRRISNGEQLLVLLADVKSELELELLSEANGAQLRARMQWAEEGEASTSFFLQQEKVQGKKRDGPDGTIVTNISDIVLTWTEFTRNYTKPKSLIQEFKILFFK